MSNTVFVSDYFYDGVYKHTVLDKFHQRYKGGVKMKHRRIRNAPYIKHIYLRKCHRVHYYVGLYKTDVECAS